MIDIISDKDLRALINSEGLGDGNHFGMWTAEDQENILSDIFEWLSVSDRKSISHEALDFMMDEWEELHVGTFLYARMGLRDYLRTILEQQINDAVDRIVQIRDEENRG